jgi:hypothetical protein
VLCSRRDKTTEICAGGGFLDRLSRSPGAPRRDATRFYIFGYQIPGSGADGLVLTIDRTTGAITVNKDITFNGNITANGTCTGPGC